MRELLPDLENWLKAGERVAIATVISTWGSAPRGAGSVMAISEKGNIAGSVSGGCVEGAVIQAAQEVIKSDKPQRLHFGVEDETAWNVGLACGGEIDIFVQPIKKDVFQPLLSRLRTDQESVLTTVISAEGDQLGAQLLADAAGNAIVGDPKLKVNPTDQNGRHAAVVERGVTQLFVNPLHASPTLVAVGGGHIAVALAKIAKIENFRTVVIDPRKAFSTPERFAHVDKLVQAWPKQAFAEVPLTSTTAIASLSHDPKIDDPALIAALKSKAFYIGALGSQRNHERRRKRLLEAGISESELARIHGPIGLEIGAETPEEIALAIMAQVIAAYRS